MPGQKMKTKLFLSVLVWIGFMSVGNGQFFFNGVAVATNDSCVQLTSATNGVSGSVWNETKINLNESFDVALQIFLGCKDDDGADGIVFGFQPLNTSIGGAGGGIGFEGIVPSVGIEFDTWQNPIFADPFEDHIAIIRNGNLSHMPGNNLAGPVSASATSSNIEDCQYHELLVRWNANTLTLTVFFDCEERLSYTGDIVNEIFDGDPEVFWGFTSATGGANNRHEICFTYTTFLDQLEDVVVCPGGQVELQARGGVSYRWTPEAGLSNPNIPNPVAAPSVATLYTVEITDECNIPFYDEVMVDVAGDSVFFDLGPDTSLCEGELLFLDVTTPTATYQWSNGPTTPNLTIDRSGIYAVTVTRTDTFCISSDKIFASYTRLPQVDLGPNIELCEGQDTVLNAFFAEAESYEWQTGADTDTLVVDEEGIYSVSVINKCGVAIDQILVEFDDCNEIYIPNAFSPNGDGINDILTIRDGGDTELVHFFRIFDRWGGLVHEVQDFLPNDNRFGWNGKIRGKLASQGVYTYVMQATFRDGKTLFFGGDITLLR